MVKQNLFNRDFFIIPGGGIEADETPEQAALRELKEECGLDGKIVKCLTINYRKNGNTEYIFWVEVSETQQSIVGKDPELIDEDQIITDVQWMKLDELSEKDRAFLWSYGLMDVCDFGQEVIGWGNTISYPV